jgi:NAD(P)-dependent dehydrogenase (short-subunit alcohol dehydrogenase family)
LSGKEEQRVERKNIFDLSNRVAIVTGGGGGLGRAFCEAMAEYGADVVCVDDDGKKARECVENLRSYGHRAIAVQSDIADNTQVEAMVKKTVTELGKIDILFNNAAVTDLATKLYETPIAVWDRMIRVNLTGVFLCMRAVLPVMIKQKRGSIINISSAGAFGANSPTVVPPCYGASKAGVISLTRTGAVEHGRDGIRVNCIAPGVHDTGLGTLTDPTEEKKRRQIMQNNADQFIPLGRIAKPNEIKGLAVYLASDASSYITGQVFIEDGGWLAQI